VRGQRYKALIQASGVSFTYSGTPKEGDRIMVHFICDGTYDVGCPSALRVGAGEQTASTHSLEFLAGAHLIVWSYIAGAWWQTDDSLD